MKFLNVVVFLFLFNQVLLAEESQLLADSTAVISNDSLGVTRYLIQFPEPDFEVVHLIDSMIVSIPLTDGEGVLDGQELDINAMLTEWVGLVVSWTTPWETPGGDVDDFYITGRVDTSTSWLSVDISPLYVALYQGYIYDYGFMVKLADEMAGPLYLPNINQSFITVYSSDLE